MINPKKRMIYVAGAYSGPDVLTVLDNMRLGIELSSTLFRKGFSPFCPWLDYHFCLNIPKEYLTVDMFYNYSIDFLEVCNAVLLTDNERNPSSGGTNKELQKAHELGIPIFYTLEELLDWAKE